MRRLTLTTKLGLGGLALLVLIALLAPPLLGGDAERLSDTVRAGSSAAHPLGTDALGRDMLARTLAATRLTLLMAAGATLIAVLAGLAFGAGLALAGHRVRRAGDRAIQLLVAFPPILLAIAFVSIFRPGALSATAAIGIAMTPAFARMTNALAVGVAARDHVTVARLMGRSRAWILARHVLPNIADTLLVLTSVAFASAVIALSALGFLGLGVQPPSYDWGGLLSEALEALYTNPVQAVGPVVAILATGLCAGLIGDGVAASLAPQQLLRGGRRRLPAAEMRAAPAAVSRNGGAPAPGLVVRNLCVARPDGVRLVRGVSLEAAPGEVVGIVGESGSGKTLTALAIARLLPDGLRATAEQLRVDDLDLLGEAEPRRLATELGIVYQDPLSSLNPVLRIGTQMIEVPVVHGGVAREQALAEAAAALDRVRVRNAEGQLRRHPHELSGGMRQRAMLATALMTRPRLLIADEPTTALDVTVQAEVLSLLREANEQHGTTILFISHDIAVVAQICHRVLVMYAGRVVEELTPEQLRAGDVGHPYTRALLASTPRLEGVRAARLTGLAGRPPDPSDADGVGGCRFAPRCAFAVDACHAQEPSLRRTRSGHVARCIRVEELVGA